MPSATAQASGRSYWSMTLGIVAESDLSGNLQSEYVFFGGKRVAPKDFPSNAVSYYFSDELKTADVITDSAGTIKSESDYYLYGGELPLVSNDSNHYKHNGKERDTETGLDYYGARYYGNWFGRYLTPDWAGKPTTVPYANFGNPQSLNLYTYGKNNPTTFGDPDGHCVEDACVVEGVVVIGFLVSSYLASPSGQQALRNAVDFVSTMVGSRFEKSSPPPSTSTATQTSAPATTGTNVQSGTPGSTTTSVQTGTPASTSQAGTVQTGPLQSTKETGSYTNTHASGRTYNGKGSRARSQASGKRIERQTGDKHTATDWTESANGRETFKDESRRIDANGGANSSGNHNQIESPGKSCRKQDGSN